MKNGKLFMAKAKTPPSIILIAGANGAGKSTSAPAILARTLHITEFVNADVIARGLSAFDPDTVALSAGKIMLERLKSLAAARQTFAFESTLAARSFAPWIRELKATGYEFHLFYFWLKTTEAAIGRVAARVKMGGHDVPAETVRRRYHGGLTNFFRLYLPLATTWEFYNNSGELTKIIAKGEEPDKITVTDDALWRRLSTEYSQ